MTSAYAYLRVSGRSQVEGEGLPRQLDAIRRYARAHDYRLIRVFREEGVSGKHELENRPALSRLVEAAPESGTRPVLIERLDRLARDLMIQETIIADLRRRRLPLISVHEPDLLSTDPSRTLVRQMLGAVAEYDRAMLVARLRAAKDRIRERDGQSCEGAKPYGHYNGESEVLTVMGELRAQGLGYDTIARRLTEQGLLTRKGTPWASATVRRILLRAGGAS